MKKYYKQTIEEIFHELRSGHRGLAQEEAGKRLSIYGPNLLQVKGVPLWKKMMEPFMSVFMLMLGIAIVISVLSNELIDAAIIGSIILITVVIYYAQRFSSDRVLKALERHDIQMVAVYRDGKIAEVESEELVPGDVIKLYEGQKVPADLRIIEAENTRVNEALLTGESTPSHKSASRLVKDKQVYEQSNMLFQGSYVVSGVATGVVVATGNQTQFGKIAALARQVNLSSPVKKKIDLLISQIVGAVMMVAVLVLLLGLYRGLEISESLRLVLTFSVSAIPESLPIAISVILVLGMRRMAKQKALVRSMAAIENVGIITTIATDKTGTLTKNELRVQDVWTPHAELDLQEIAIQLFLTVNQNEGKLHDPLDNALQLFSAKYQKELPADYKLEKTLPFDLHFAKSGNIYRRHNQYDIYVKGAPEKIIETCLLPKVLRDEIIKKLHSLTGSGYRVIAVAKLEKQNKVALELKDLPKKGFSFICLVAVADELRFEAKTSVSMAQEAGVVVRMVTGDHFETAFAIGKQLGLVKHKNEVMDCTNMSEISDAQLAKEFSEVRVFARVLPQYKYRILKLLKKTEITAMTGDGVNDVPALANAHIGIAMGAGSQIAKEAGDIVLLDNNFKSIISALREGRVIFDNIQRMLFYLLSTNLGEVLTTVVALLIGLPLPLLPVQILWTNLGTDTAMVIPLGLEPAEHNVMKRQPRKPKSPIIGKMILSRMILIAITMMAVALGVFSHFLQSNSETYARTLAFTALVAMQLSNSLNARSMWQSILRRVKTHNHSIIFGLIAAISLYTLAVFGPLGSVLHLEALRLEDMLVVWLISIVAITFVNETHKYIGRRYFGQS